MLNALIEYYESVSQAEANGKAPPPIPKYIGESIMHIANKLSTKINFVMYSFREELVGDAIEKMVEAVNLRKFDFTLSSNPFAYFTQISWNCFLQRIEKEKKEAYIKHKNLQNISIEDLYREFDNMDMNHEEHNRVIENFEKPKEKNNYPGHKNLSYAKNRKKKLTEETKSDTVSE